MGCGLSAAKTYRNPIVHTDTSMQDASESTYFEEPSSCFSVPQELLELLQGVSRLPKSPNLKVCVSISDDSFPVFTAPLYFSNGDETTINLPIVACSVHFNGRILLIGSFEMLLKMCKSQNTDASIFFENIMHWSTELFQGNGKVCLLGIEEPKFSELQKSLTSFGFRVKNIGDSVPKSCTIIVPTNYKNVDFIRQCLDKNNCIVLCYYDLENVLPESEERNYYDDLLLEAGIPFARSELMIGCPTSDVIKTIPLKDLLNLNLSSLIKDLKEIVSEEKVDIEDLDSVVTLLRLHCSTITGRNNKKVCELLQILGKFIFNIGVDNESGICPNIESKIATILASELFDKVPASILEGIDLSFPFPGKTGNVSLSTYKLEVNPLNEWVSTGIWLPPGLTANVEFSREVEGCTLQIGSSARSLISSTESLSWKRWPVVTLYYDITNKIVNIASPFGGIIYFIFEEPVDPFEVTISNVCRYPKYLLNKSQQSEEVWNDTKDIDVPFGEIETPNCIFTLPSKYIRDSSTLTFAQRISDIIGMMFNFTAMNDSKQVRIVLDVEVPLNYEEFRSYPMYIDEKMFSKLIIDEPSRELFKVLSNAAFFSLPEKFFPGEIEDLLALVAACAVLKQAYPTCNPIECIEGVKPNMFLELWDVYEKFDHHAFVESFRSIRKYENTSQVIEYEMWDAFIKEYESNVQSDLSTLRNLNMSSSSSSFLGQSASLSLQSFIVSDMEIDIMK